MTAPHELIACAWPVSPYHGAGRKGRQEAVINGSTRRICIPRCRQPRIRGCKFLTVSRVDDRDAATVMAIRLFTRGG